MHPIGCKEQSIDLNMILCISHSCNFCGSYYNGCRLSMHIPFSLCCALKMNWLVTQRPKHFQFRTRLFFLNADSLVLDWDSWFFTRWVTELTITIWNKITVTHISYNDHYFSQSNGYFFDYFHSVGCWCTSIHPCSLSVLISLLGKKTCFK